MTLEILVSPEPSLLFVTRIILIALQLTKVNAGLCLQIVIEGIAGRSYRGDIAIDDLKLIKNPCPLPGESLGFITSYVQY